LAYIYLYLALEAGLLGFGSVTIRHVVQLQLGHPGPIHPTGPGGWVRILLQLMNITTQSPGTSIDYLCGSTALELEVEKDERKLTRAKKGLKRLKRALKKVTCVAPLLFSITVSHILHTS
jgi:hypothetical protein